MDDPHSCAWYWFVKTVSIIMCLCPEGNGRGRENVNLD